MPVKIDFEPAAAAIDFEPDSSGIDFEPEQPEAGLSETTLAQLNQDIRLTEGGRQMGAGNDRLLTAIGESLVPTPPTAQELREADLAKRAGVEPIPLGTRIAAGLDTGIRQGMATPGRLVHGAADLAIGAVGAGNTRLGRWNADMLRQYADYEAAMQAQDVQTFGPNDIANQLASGTGRALTELPLYIAPGMGAATPAQAVARSSAAGGVVGGGTQYAQDRGAGRGRLDAATYATASGLITALTTRAFGATGAESIFRKEGIQGIRNRLVSVLKDAGLEGAEEMADQVQQDFLERYSRNPDKPVDATIKEVLMAGAIGGIVGGGVAGVTQGAEAGTQAARDLLTMRNPEQEMLGNPLESFPEQGQRAEDNATVNAALAQLNTDKASANPPAAPETKIDFEPEPISQSQATESLQNSDSQDLTGNQTPAAVSATSPNAGASPISATADQVRQELRALPGAQEDLSRPMPALTSEQTDAGLREMPAAEDAAPVTKGDLKALVNFFQNGGPNPFQAKPQPVLPIQQKQPEKLPEIPKGTPSEAIAGMVKNAPGQVAYGWREAEPSPGRLRKTFGSKQEAEAFAKKQVASGNFKYVGKPFRSAIKADTGQEFWSVETDTLNPAAYEQPNNLAAQPDFVAPDEPAATKIEIKNGDTVSVVTRAGAKPRNARVIQLQPDGSAQVVVAGEQTARWLNADQITPSRRAVTLQAKADELAGFAPEQQTQIKERAAEFRQLVEDYAPQLEWTPAEAYDESFGTDTKDVGFQKADLRRNAIKQAMRAVFPNGQENSQVDQANALPALERYLKEKFPGDNSVAKRRTLEQFSRSETSPEQTATVERDQATLDQLAANRPNKPEFRGLRAVGRSVSPGQLPIRQRGSGSGVLSSAGASTLSELERIFGVRIIFVENARFNGVRINGTNLVLINAKSPRATMAIAGHELLHHIKATHPGLYADFVAQARALLKNSEKFRSELAAKGYTNISDALVEEEMFADVLGDAVLDPVFLQQLARSEPNLFKRFARTAVKWLEKLIAKAKAKPGFGSSEFVTDLEAMRDHLAELLRESARQTQFDRAGIVADAGQSAEQGQDAFSAPLDSDGKNERMQTGEPVGPKSPQTPPQPGQGAEALFRRAVERHHGEQYEMTVTDVGGQKVYFSENGDYLRLDAGISPTGKTWFVNFDRDGQIINQSDASIFGQTTPPLDAINPLIGRLARQSRPPHGEAEVFIRYGAIPKSGRSRNSVTGELEAGVSVYRAKWNPAFQRYELADATHAATAMDLIAQGKSAKLYSGNTVGRGSDGEPVISNPKLLGNLTYSENGYSFDSRASTDGARNRFSLEGGDMFGFDAPESVAEQKAREKREADAQKLKKAKDAMQERAGARLIGKDLDTTQEMFGAEVKRDKSGQADMFSREQSEFAKLQADITAAEAELMTAIRQHMNPPAGMRKAEALEAKNDAHRKLRDLLRQQLKLMTDIRNLDAARSPEETADLISQTVDLLNSIQDDISERTAKSEAVPADLTKLRTDLQERLMMLKGWSDDQSDESNVQSPKSNVTEAGRGRFLALESATDPQHKTFGEWWQTIKNGLRYLTSPIPELPLTGERAEKSALFRRGYRLFAVENNRVRKEAAERVNQVLEPLTKLGRTPASNEALRQYYKLGEERERAAMDETKRKAIAERMLKLEETTLNKDPFNLFRRLVLYKDLRWRGTYLKNDQGKPITLPMGLTVDEVASELRRTYKLIENHPDGLAITEALRRHYKLTDDLQKSILEHGEIIPESLRNPLYFPHHVIDSWSGNIARVRPSTEEDFRKYLIAPTGSAKLIQTDYLKAMYLHTADVLAHNARVDLVERYWRPYDVSDQLKAQHGDKWNLPWNIPAGYKIFTPFNKLPLRMDYVLSREVLADKLGVLFNDGDLRERMGDTGKVLKVKPEDLHAAMVAGEKIQWVLPAEIADALTGIARREAAASNPGLGHAIGLPFRAVNNFWKKTKLFAPWNWVRYEYGNLSTDAIDKVLAADPGAAKYLGRAAREVWTADTGEQSPEFKAAAREGVFDTITAGEAGELTKLPEFKAFLTGNEARWDKARTLLETPMRGSKFREAVFRYAKFLADVERLRAGKEPVYAGAFHGDIEALGEDVDGQRRMLEGDELIYAKAAEISLKTYGDYNSLGVAGQWLRQYAVPFWSWQDVNFRYHANQVRNIADGLLGKTGPDLNTARKAALRYAGVRVVSTLLAIGIAKELWNQFGGPMLGLWDDDDDLEAKLSEADRRRGHLIVGKDKAGKVLVVYTPSAWSDVAEWMGGQNMKRLFMEYVRGQITLDQFVKDYAKQMPRDVLNKLGQSLGPLGKAPYETISGKSTFPDVLDQRNIPESERWWRLVGTLTDDRAVNVLRGAFDQDYYSQPATEQLQQIILQIRRRDPEQWSYYEAREDAADWKEAKTGKRFEQGNYDAPEAQALRNFRKAIYRGDVASAERFYGRLLQFGYTAERLDASIRNQAPLSDLNEQERAEYVKTLTLKQRQELELATKYYNRLKALDGREKQLFPKKGQQPSPKPELLKRIVEDQSRNK